MAASVKKSSAGNFRSDKASIIDAMRSIARSLRSSSRQLHKSAGITTAQLDVLRALEDKPALSINELAERTYTHQSSVSIVVGRLVDDRLVSRSVSRTDGRRLSVSLTAAGRAVLRKAPDSSETRLLSAMKSMNRSELSDLAGCLQKLSSVLESDSEGESGRPKLA
jgi:DNA-binding MarR family transcriptional regulator